MKNDVTVFALRRLVGIMAALYVGDTRRSWRDLKTSLRESLNLSVANAETPITDDQAEVVDTIMGEIARLPD